MRLSCTMELLQGMLSVSWYGQTVPVNTPWDGFVAGSEDLERANTLPPPLLLGTSLFPAADALLPPLFLLDPPSQPQEEYCGLAQMILSPHAELGEPLQVRLSAGVQAYWREYEPLSPLHQQAHIQRQTHMKRLFALPLEAFPDDEQAQQAKALQHFAYAFPHAWAEEDTQELLHILRTFSRVKPHWRTLPWLFSCLQHPCEDIGTRASTLLQPVAHLIPWQKLEAIVWQGPPHARLCALRLAAHHTQQEEAISLFLATRWDTHPSLRIASIDGLVLLETWRLELLAVLETALADEAACVRATALWHLLHLCDPHSAVFLVTAYYREQEAWLRVGLHLCLIPLLPALPGSGGTQLSSHEQM